MSSQPEGKGGFVRAIGLFPATALNMSQMVGIGPFITIPLILAVLTGPLAIVGWVVGALIAICDGLVCRTRRSDADGRRELRLPA